MSNFCITFPLVTEKYQEDILNKRFEIGRRIYNSLVSVTQNRYNEMVKTKKYRTIMSELKSLYISNDKSTCTRRKKIYKLLSQMYKDYGLHEYAFHSDVKFMQKHFEDNIDAFTAQKIATSLWAAYSQLLFGEGKSIHYKKYGSMVSLEGKSNKTGIRFKNNTLLWNGLSVPVKIDNNNLYELQAIQNPICFNRVIRRFIRGKYKFYLQIIFKGVPPTKRNKNNGKPKHRIGKGDVGLDIGTQTIAICSKKDVKLYELADGVQNIENEKIKLLRYMDRSRRCTNPDKFNVDGTYKKFIKTKWIYSNRYKKAKNKLKELHRKQASIRKLQHEILANYIISLGDKIYVETMNYKALQARSKTATINKNTGRINKKKRFGKSLANKAPAMLLEIINRKLSYNGLELIKVNTQKVKASQYDHFNDNYNKKSLSKRWNDFNGIKIQRDMYSAFLLMNVNNDLNSVNREKCIKTFDRFKSLHDKEVERLKGKQNLSSIGI